MSTLLVSSSLAWIEVARVVRALRDATLAEVADDVDAALGGWCQTRFLDENGNYEE